MKSFLNGVGSKNLMGQVEWLKTWVGCQNPDGDGLRILDLLIMFILPKAQYAMTIGHCQMQLGAGGAFIP